MVTMVVAVLAMACGYFAGGTIGDFLFRRTPRGRLIVSTVAVLLGALLLVITLNLPLADRGLFVITLACPSLPYVPGRAGSTLQEMKRGRPRPSCASWDD